MKLHLDAEADALFLILQEGPWNGTREVAPGINLEIGADGEVMAIEVLSLSRRGGRAILQHMELDFAPDPGGRADAFEIPQELADRLLSLVPRDA